MGYLLLFVSAFAAATILPLSSEVILIALLRDGEALHWVWLVATMGNVLGSLLNWFLGRYISRFRNRSWFPFTPKKIARAERWFKAYGKWSLLLAWLPLGDALTVVAGVLRVNVWVFLSLVGIGKGLRYLLVALIYLNLV